MIKKILGYSLSLAVAFLVGYAGQSEALITGVSAGGTGIESIIEDTTPQLGGTLDTQGEWISGDSDAEGIRIDTGGEVGFSDSATFLGSSNTFVFAAGVNILELRAGTAAQIEIDSGAGANNGSIIFKQANVSKFECAFNGTVQQFVCRGIGTEKFQVGLPVLIDTTFGVNGDLSVGSGVTRSTMTSTGEINLPGADPIVASTWTATYTGGSAHVCVNDAGELFISEAACP